MEACASLGRDLGVGDLPGCSGELGLMGRALSESGRGGSYLLFPSGTWLCPEILMLLMGSSDAKRRTIVSRDCGTAALTAEGAGFPCPSHPSCITEEEARAGTFHGVAA